MSYIEDLFSLRSTVSLVTGAARGNGEAMARALALAGSEVILVDIEECVTDVSGDINETGGKSNAYICDLADKDQLTSLIEIVEKKHNKISVLVNNAGVTFGQDILEYPDELWDRTYKINLLAPYKMSQGISKIMVNNQTCGSIINITSLNSELAFPDNPSYITFKGALKQMTKSFALDLGKYGIRCNNIGPGYIKTNMTKGSWADLDKRKSRQDKTALGRWGTPQDLCGAVIFLASSASGYVTGQDLYIDGGWLIKGL